MASGDASRTWFSEMVETLRQDWQSELSWEQIFTLRDRLDAMLQEIRTSRNIRPTTMWWPVCNQRTQQAPPSVSIRALIFALGRFGMVPLAVVKSLEKRWAKHRKQHNLDRNGKLAQAAMTDPSCEGPAIHFHSSASESSMAVAPGKELQHTEPLRRRPTRNVIKRRPR